MSTSPTKTKFLWLNFIGLLVAFTGLAGAWFEPVTHPRLSAWQVGMGLGPASPSWLAILLSFGLLGFFLICWGALASWEGNRPGAIRAGSGLILLGFAFVVQLALGRPVWLEYAMDGAVDFTRTMGFANQYSVPISFFSSPAAGMTIEQEGWVDRFALAFLTLKYGWYWFMFGSGILLLSALAPATDSEPQPRLRALAPVAFVFVLAMILMTVGPLFAQAESRWGDHAAVRGETVSAERHFRSAIAWDEWYQVRPTLYLRIGALQDQSGDTQAPESLFYRAFESSEITEYDNAMFYFGQALKTKDPILAAVVRREMADRAMEEGLAFYLLGQQGAARQDWLQSLELKPKQAAAYYMLGCVDMNLANWEEAASFFQKVLPNCSNTQIRASAVAGLGDCYYKAGKVNEARAEYFQSLKIEPAMNYRVLKSLTEYYFR